MNDNLPLVSCICPTRNRLGFLADAIHMFTTQDYPNKELIVLDDGDESAYNIVKRAQDSTKERIRYERYNSIKLDIGTARNDCCELANGSLIAHWDDDDWYPTWRLSLQVDAIMHLSDGFFANDICGTSRYFFHDTQMGKAWHYSFDGQPWVGGNSMMYRKSYWERVKFPKLKPGEDGEDTRFQWSGGAHIYDMRNPALCIATIHDGNRFKRCRNFQWEQVLEATVKQLKVRDGILNDMRVNGGLH